MGYSISKALQAPQTCSDVQVRALTEALSLATERLAAAGLDQQHFAEGEIRAAKMLHAAAAEVEVLR